MSASGRRFGPGLADEVTPPWPFRLPARRGPDLVSRVERGVWERFLHVQGAPVLVRAWQRPGSRAVRLSAFGVERGWLVGSASGFGTRQADPEDLAVALQRGRHALGLDDDLRPFYERFRRDRLLGPAIRRVPWLRLRRCAWPWEALAWAVTEQLIEVERAQAIQRRIVARWGARVLPPDRRRPLRDVPGAATLATLSPAELAGCGLAPRRALALIEAAREIAAGRVDPARAGDDARLLRIANIGPWTVQVLGQKGRGEFDSLPAGDLAYLKLVPRLLGYERRCTVEEVERFYAPFAPYRGLAGLFTLAGRRSRGAERPLRWHPPRPELEAV